MARLSHVPAMIIVVAAPPGATGSITFMIGPLREWRFVPDPNLEGIMDRNA